MSLLSLLFEMNVNSSSDIVLTRFKQVLGLRNCNWKAQENVKITQSNDKFVLITRKCANELEIVLLV